MVPGSGPGGPGLHCNVLEFDKLSFFQDNSGQIDAKELGLALANGDMTMFSEEACRMMINMFDTNRTGTIDVHEFGKLFNYINDWKRMFENYDKNKEGTLSQEDFVAALQSMGYR